jgi:hypothetical protein
LQMFTVNKMPASCWSSFELQDFPAQLQQLNIFLDSFHASHSAT